MLREATGAARDLTAGPRYSAPRLLVDLLAIVGLAWLSETVGNPVLTGLVVVFIGAAPLHDVLVHGHEAMHGNASRNPWVNAFILWFTHALVGISGRAHRSFHFDHHRFVGSDRDPEHRIHGTVDGRTTCMGAFRVVARDPVDFRRGMDSLSGVCRQHLQADPIPSTMPCNAANPTTAC